MGLGSTEKRQEALSGGRSHSPRKREAELSGDILG